MESTSMIGDGILTDLEYALRQCRRGDAERAYDALQRVEDALPELRRLASLGAQMEAGGRVALFGADGACRGVSWTAEDALAGVYVLSDGVTCG